MEIKYKISLEDKGKVIFGKGRKELFRAIEECKSLKGAAEKLNMSYRAAWRRLKASEDRLGKKIVDVDPLRRGMVTGWNLLGIDVSGLMLPSDRPKKWWREKVF